MAVLTSLEAKELPLACTVYNTLEDFGLYLRAGTTKTSFGEKTNHFLQNLPLEQRRVKIKSFQAVFSLSLQKLEAHIDNLPAYPYYKAVRIFATASRAFHMTSVTTVPYHHFKTHLLHF